jgi:cobalt-zinc-cadmium resistance protein CzcA
MGPISTGLGEIYQFEVKRRARLRAGRPGHTPCYTPMELRTILDWFVNYQLRSVPGIVEVNSFGGELKTYQVTVDPAEAERPRPERRGRVRGARGQQPQRGGGYIEHQGEQYLVRGEGLSRASRTSATSCCAHDDGRRAGPRPRRRRGRVRADDPPGRGHPRRRGEAVVGIVMMLMGENARVVVDGVKENARDELRNAAGRGHDRRVLRPHRARRPHDPHGRQEPAEGGASSSLVLLLLLGNLRGGLIVASAIPLSMLVAFTGMRAAGLSGNLMSLGAIDFGLIVDGSVVMIENIVRVLSHQRPRGPGVPAPGAGPRRRAAGRAAGGVRGGHHHHRLPADPRAARASRGRCSGPWR